MHMKRVVAVSLGALLAASAWGQHAGSGGHAMGGSGHASGGFSSAHSFAAAGPARGYGGVPAYRPNLAAQPRFQYSGPTGPAPFGGSYPIGERPKPAPHPGGYRPYYYSRGVYAVPGWLNSGFYDSGYPPDYTDQPPAAAAPDADAPPGPADEQAYAQMPARPAYQADSTSSQDLQAPPQITLLFKDGRPPQVVQNYAVTRTTLYVLDGAKRREIPLDQLDLPQTEKTNHDAGVDFEVPVIED